MNSWYYTTINLSGALRDFWKSPLISKDDTRQLWSLDIHDTFSSKWLSMMSSHGLNIIDTLLFYRLPNFATDIAHVDLSYNEENLSDSFALNVIIGGAGSKMIWYDLPNILANTQGPGGLHAFKAWPISKLIEIEQVEIKPLVFTMVRVDIPHRIIIGHEPRWCISVRFDMRYKSWDEAVEYMKSKHLLIDR